MLLNLTPHAVRVIPADGSPETVIPPSGQVARVASAPLLPFGREEGNIPLFVADGARSGVTLPAIARDGFGAMPGLIVSRIVAEALRGENDARSVGLRLFVPADLVRDASGAVIGCRGLEVL